MKKVGIYQLIRQIGKGSYGCVYQARKQNSHQRYAIKMIPVENMEQRLIDLVEMEVELLQKIDHPNIIKLFDVRRTKNNYYLVFEFCEKGDLEKYLKKHCEVPLREDIIKKLIYDIAGAVRLIHSKNIVHRDIKLANILLTRDFTVKLSDFGFAKFSNSEMLMETYCGTPMNMAPEILFRQQYTFKCDIWSLGVVVYQLVYGKLPFIPSGGKGLLDLIEVIQKTQEVSFPLNPIMSQSFKRLIRGSLQKDPQKRLSIEQFFSNEWVAQGRLSNSTTSQLLRSISSAVEPMEPESPLLLNQKSENQQRIIARRLMNNVSVELQKLNMRVKEIMDHPPTVVKPDIFKKIVGYLASRLVRDVKKTLIRVVYKNEEFQFSVKDIPELDELLENHKDVELTSPLNKTIQLLEFIADDQKNNSKEKVISDYKSILNIFPLFRRFTYSISITTSSLVENVRLKAVKKWFLERQFHDGFINGVTINIQYTDKNQDVAKKVSKLEELVALRVRELERREHIKK